LLAAQAAYLRHLALAPGARAVESDGVYAVRTGIASNSENGVVSDGGSPLAPEAVRELISWFDEARVPASWLLAEGEARAANAGVLERGGCRPERRAVEMSGVLEELELAQIRAQPHVRAAPVEDLHGLDGWLDVAGACGWFDTQAERSSWRHVLGDLHEVEPAASRLYLARRDDAPVGMAAAFFTPDAVLLSAVGVLAQERRRGIGRLLATIRLEEAKDRGCGVAVLAPSPDGKKLYDSLGFETRPQPADRWFYLPAT
jgi:GNAT superfamily N-acetyltransferase